MTDLLTPEAVRDIQSTGISRDGPVEDASWHYARLDRLCRDYLTLWDRYDLAVELLDDATTTLKTLREIDDG